MPLSRYSSSLPNARWKKQPNKRDDTTKSALSAEFVQDSDESDDASSQQTKPAIEIKNTISEKLKADGASLRISDAPPNAQVKKRKPSPSSSSSSSSGSCQSAAEEKQITESESESDGTSDASSGSQPSRGKSPSKGRGLSNGVNSGKGVAKEDTRTKEHSGTPTHRREALARERQQETSEDSDSKSENEGESDSDESQKDQSSHNKQNDPQSRGRGDGQSTPTVQERPRIPYKPPTGFCVTGNLRSSHCERSGLLSSERLHDKQVWHISAPSDASLESIKNSLLRLLQDVPAESALEDQEFFAASVDQDQSTPTLVLLPSSWSNKYRALNTNITKTINIRRHLTLPSHVLGKPEGSQARLAVSSRKIPQPADLKMRFRPFGASSDSENEAVEHQPSTPARFRHPPVSSRISPKKRKGRENGDVSVEAERELPSSAKRRKKRDGEIQSTPSLEKYLIGEEKPSAASDIHVAAQSNIENGSPVQKRSNKTETPDESKKRKEEKRLLKQKERASDSNLPATQTPTAEASQTEQSPKKQKTDQSYSKKARPPVNGDVSSDMPPPAHKSTPAKDPSSSSKATLPESSKPKKHSKEKKLPNGTHKYTTSSSSFKKQPLSIADFSAEMTIQEKRQEKKSQDQAAHCRRSNSYTSPFPTGRSHLASKNDKTNGADDVDKVAEEKEKRKRKRKEEKRKKKSEAVGP